LGFNLQFHDGNNPFKLYADQKAKILETWQVIATPGLSKGSVEGMPAGIEAVVAANGKFTRY
jgi:hypothetical protein